MQQPLVCDHSLMSADRRSSNVTAWHSNVRAADCDWFGHANNAVYTDYVVSATLATWGAEFGASAWRLRTIEMDFRTPVTHDDEIEVASRRAGGENGTVRCAYRIENRRERVVAAEAVATWAVPNRTAIGEWPVDPESETIKLRSAPAKPNRSEAYVYRKNVVAQLYEADYTGMVNPVWVFRWGWAQAFSVPAQVGWPMERWKKVGCAAYQIHRSAKLYGELYPGETVEVQSRLCDIQRIRATWEHRVLRDGELMAIDFAEGAFLNNEGKVSPPPSGLIESILAGREVG